MRLKLRFRPLIQMARWQFLFVAVVFFLSAGSAQATNYMTWGAECSPPGTPCRATSGYFNDQSAEWLNNFIMYPTPKTSITTAVKHSGSSSMKLMPDGNGTNEHLGTENVFFHEYEIGAYPGTFLGSTLYRRWWMRIEPGFNWGPSVDAGGIKWIRTASDQNHGFYTFYIHDYGVSMAECDNTGYDALCYDNENILHGARAWNIFFDWPSRYDGQWHEFIIKMKINSSTSCVPPACDSENKVYIDGQLVGQHDGFRFVPNDSNAIQYEIFGPGSPYFQLGRSGAGFGGTWYLDDMSIDDVWNSTQYSDPSGGGDTTAPTRSAGGPTGTLSYGTTSTTLTVTTNENATCKYGTTAGVAYASQPTTFTTTGGTTHTRSLTGLTNGSSYTYYVRCSDGSSNANTSDYSIAFSVAASSGANECTNWQSAHPTWIWCDDFETDQSASWWDYNPGGAAAFARSAGNGYSGSYSMRATFPNTTGAASGGDFKIVFGDTAYTPNVKSSTDVTELYWRAWIKNSSNWQPGDGWKFTRAVGCASSSGYCPNQSFMSHWWMSNASYSNFLGVDPASGVSGSSVVTTTWNDFAHFTWLGADGGSIPVMGSARANTWQCIEGHLKLNALGASDGVQELWVDSTLDAQATGLNLRGSYAGTYNGINLFSVENYENAGLAITGRIRDWDNLVLATTRVGCTLDGGGDTTPPAAPTGLGVE
ncbi:MAG: hypothetical protein WBP40_00900 [Candidatus Moraniibacteriota bacterium]